MVGGMIIPNNNNKPQCLGLFFYLFYGSCFYLFTYILLSKWGKKWSLDNKIREYQCYANVKDILLTLKKSLSDLRSNRKDKVEKCWHVI